VTKPLTHLTEWGLGVCAGIPLYKKDLAMAGLRPDTHACSGRRESSEGIDWLEETLLSGKAKVVVPTCPRCAVLRDEALATGVVPARPAL